MTTFETVFVTVVYAAFALAAAWLAWLGSRKASVRARNAQECERLEAEWITRWSPLEPELQAWTPAERDAYGINDTNSWIDATDKVLEAAARATRQAAQDAALAAGWNADGTRPTWPSEPVPDEAYEQVEFWAWGSGRITGSTITTGPAPRIRQVS